MMAARRVLPPDLIVPPVASWTFMKLTGPDGMPPPDSFSWLDRSFDQSAPTPDPNLNSRADSPMSCQMSSTESSTEMMKQADAWGRSYGSTSTTSPFVKVPPGDRLAARVPDAVQGAEPDVEPHRRVERAVLAGAEPGELVIERLGVGVRREVALVSAPVGDGPRDAVDELLEAVLAVALGGRAVPLLDVAVEVLRRDDVDRQRAERVGELDGLLLEDGLAGEVLDRGVAGGPGDAVERVLAGGREHAVDVEAVGVGRGGGFLRSHDGRGGGGRQGAALGLARSPRLGRLEPSGTPRVGDGASRWVLLGPGSSPSLRRRSGADPK